MELAVVEDVCEKEEEAEEVGVDKVDNEAEKEDVGDRSCLTDKLGTILLVSHFPR